MTRVLSIALTLVCLGATLLAQTPDTSKGLKLETIVIQARGANIPGTFHVQRDSIRAIQQATSSLGQYLATEPSVSIKQYGPAGIASPAFRGTGAGHTQVYWNGISLNSPLLGQSDLSLGTAGLFDDIQTVYGAGSLNHGSGGFGGALILKTSNQVLQGQKLGLATQLEGGSFGNYRGMGSLGFRKNRFTSNTKLLYQQGQNNFPFRNGNPAEVHVTEHSATQQWSALQQFQWELGRNHNPLSFQTWISSMDRELPASEFGSSLEEFQQDHSIRSQLKWEQMFGDQAIVAQLAHNYETLNYQQEVTGLESSSAFHGLTLRLDGRTYLEKAGTKLLDGWGIQVGADRALFSNHTVPLVESRGTFHLKSRLFKRQRFELNSLIRESWQGNQLSLPFGVLSAVWTPRFRHRFHANLSRNQRFPTLNDRYWDPGGNPDLLPESGYGTELGWLFQPGRNRPGNTLRSTLQVNAFANLVNQWIQWIPTTGSIWVPQNVHQVGNLGGEFFWNLQKTTGPLVLDFQAAYTFVQSQSLSSEIPNDQSVGQQLIYTPVHRANFRASARFKGWNLVAQESLNSRSFTSRDNQNWLPGYSLANLRLGKAWTVESNQFEVYAAVNNLFNVDYRTVAARPMPGRNFNLGLRMKLNRFQR